MAQFDVHRNKGLLQASVPFAVIVQSALFDGYRRRKVVPLRRRAALPKQPAMASSRIIPVFRIEKIAVTLRSLDMASVAVEQIGERVGSLTEHGQAIADALDELLTRSWG